MGNKIDYAAIFNRLLDEKFYIMPRTLWMEDSNPGIVWEGGKEVKIPMLGMDGLGTMNGYKAPQGDLTLEWETKTLQWYRGRNFSIGRYDVDETNFALSVAPFLRTFLEQKVVPEIDCLRIAMAAQGAIRYGTTVVQASSGISTANIFDMIKADIATVQDKIGENEQLYIQISTSLKSVLERSSQITKFINSRDFQVRSINTRIDALDDQYIIGTPSGYMHSIFGLNDGATAGQTVGGVTFANLGPNINWLIAARPAVDGIARPQVTKVIDPDTNQEGEFWKVMFSIYHGCWIMENKGDGLLVNINNVGGSLTVETEAGASAGASTVTVTGVKPDGFKYMFKCADGTAPSVTVGTALTVADGWADLPADGKISTTNGYKITVALVAASNNKPIASGNATVSAGT